MAWRLLYSIAMFKLALLLVGACGFSPGLEAQPDAPLQTGSDTPTTTGCSVTDPQLRLCLDFEDASLQTTARDLSSGQHDGQTWQVASTTRATEKAAQLAPSSSIHVAETPDLELYGALSFELFVNPLTQGDSFPIHHGDDYALQIVGPQIRCFAHGISTAASGNLAAQRFTHVACSFDGQAVRAFVDGALVSCARDVIAVPNPENAGIDIGSGFTGGLDNIHVYARELTASELATHAGTTALPPQATDCL